MILHKEISMADDFDEWTKQQLPESMYAALQVVPAKLRGHDLNEAGNPDPLVEMMRGAKSRTVGGRGAQPRLRA